MKTVAERFWSHVNVRGPDECWEWTATRRRGGYGQTTVNGRSESANRVAWTFAHGAIPDGLWVLHRCDNPPCVNVRHLFLGTNSDNMNDAARKGRHTGQKHKGENHPLHKLTEADVIEIRAARAAGTPLATLAQRFSVGTVAISQAANRQRWKHVA